MRAYFLISLLVYTFGAFAYGTLFFLWIRGNKKKEGRRLYFSEGAITVLSSVWFLVNLLVLFAEMRVFPYRPLLAAVLTTMTLLYPPLIMHTYYDLGKDYLSRQGLWGSILAVT
jgi:hypothetical protein